MAEHATYLVTHAGVEYEVGPMNVNRWCYDIMFFGGMWNACTRSGNFQYYPEEVQRVEYETD